MPSIPQHPSNTTTSTFASPPSTPLRSRPRATTTASRVRGFPSVHPLLFNSSRSSQEQESSQIPVSTTPTTSVQPKRIRTPSSATLYKRARRKTAPTSRSPGSSTSASVARFLFSRPPSTPTSTPDPLSSYLSTGANTPILPAPISSTKLQAITSEMSFFNPLQPNFLSAKLEVRFDNDGIVDMIGGPNTGTSYSLAGHVLVTLPTLPATLEGRIREIGQLTVAVEGKGEFSNTQGRHSPLRLIRFSVDLASPEFPRVVPSPDPDRPRAAQVTIAVPFDLRLPGWLPPTCISNMTDTSYGARVEASVQWSDIPGSAEPSTRKGFWTNSSLLPSAFAQSMSSFIAFVVRRHRCPLLLTGQSVERPERHYTLRPDSTLASPVECIVTVPEWVDVHGEERSLKVSLRLRARSPTSSLLGARIGEDGNRDEGVPEAAFASTDAASSVPMVRNSTICDGAKGTNSQSDDISVHLVELGMEVEEVERYSSIANPLFTSSFPIPAEQPSTNSDRYPLLSPRSHSPESLLGIPIPDRPYRGSVTRQCLLADDGNQRNFFFADQGLGLGDRWRKVNVVLPMSELGQPGEIVPGGRPQAEVDGPFLRIRHSLQVRIVCRGLGPGAENTVIMLSTPIRFSTCPTTMPGNKSSTPMLPAYVQLFHENGELRQCDPLPLYSRSESEEVESSTTSPCGPALPEYSTLYPKPHSTFPSRPSSPASSIGSGGPTLNEDASSPHSEAIRFDPNLSNGARRSPDSSWPAAGISMPPKAIHKTRRSRGGIFVPA